MISVQRFFYFLASNCSSPSCLCPTDAVRVHLPGVVRALPVRRHRAGGDLTGVPPGQTLRPLTWSWLQWSGGWIQGLFVYCVLTKRQLLSSTVQFSYLCMYTVSISRFLETDIHQDSEWQDENRQPARQHEEEQSPSDHSMWVMWLQARASGLYSIIVPAHLNQG